MTQSTFLVRLVPPRPSFGQDLTEAEAAVMGQHVAYWSGLAQRGVALLFGPVADPKGVWGVGIVRVDDPAFLAEITASDPAILSNIGLVYEVLPMPRVILGKV